ncbi:hypothetical protein ACQV2S_03990 [Facklamia sp. P13064]|uniref:hypothetical protein n=1 Tax=unclassified Facklamia TaxID=2622293 RepID=UPI003D169995
MIIQIHHSGYQAHQRASEGLTVYGPSAVDLDFLDHETVPLTIQQIVLLGGVLDANAAQRALNYTDLVAIGRATFIEPDFALKISQGFVYYKRYFDRSGLIDWSIRGFCFTSFNTTS